MRATIVVPTETANYKEAISVVKEHFCNAYDGYTMYEATGGWENHEGRVIEEPVTVIEVYGDVPQKGGMVQVAERVREITGEEAVAYTVGGNQTVV